MLSYNFVDANNFTKHYIQRVIHQVIYLGAATNNRAETALDFFLEAVGKQGVPSRYACTFEYIYLHRQTDRQTA